MRCVAAAFRGNQWNDMVMMAASNLPSGTSRSSTPPSTSDTATSGASCSLARNWSSIPADGSTPVISRTEGKRRAMASDPTPVPQPMSMTRA